MVPLFFLFGAKIGQGQVIEAEYDSTYRLLNKEDLLNRLQQNFSKGLYNDALADANMLLTREKENLSAADRRWIWMKKADSFIDLQKTDSLKASVEALRSIAKDYPDERSKIALQLYEGIIAFNEQKLLKALEHFYKVLVLDSNDPSNTYSLSLSQLNIGLIFHNLGHYRRAIQHNKEALRLAKEIDDSKRIISVLVNLGITYKNTDSLLQAEEAFREVLALAVKDSNSFYQTMSYYNLSNVYKKQSNFATAHSMIDSSLQICERLDLEYGILLGWTTRGLIYQEEGKPNESLYWLNQAEALNQQFNNSEVKLEIIRVKSLAYSDLGDIEKAFEFQEAYLKEKDLGKETESNRLVLEWEAKMQREEADALAAESEQLRLRQRSANRQLLLLAVVLLTAIIGALLTIRQIRQKNELLSRLVEEERENSRLQIEMKNREALSQGLHIQSFLHHIEEIKEMSKSLSRKKSLATDDWSALFKHMDQGLPSEILEEFKIRFENVEQDFIEALKKSCGELTPNEINIASLLRLNLNSKEIAKLTNRSLGTINNIRSSLRKKLALDDDENLSTFLLNL